MLTKLKKLLTVLVSDGIVPPLLLFNLCSFFKSMIFYKLAMLHRNLCVLTLYIILKHYDTGNSFDTPFLIILNVEFAF